MLSLIEFTQIQLSFENTPSYMLFFFKTGKFDKVVLIIAFSIILFVVIQFPLI